MSNIKDMISYRNSIKDDYSKDVPGELPIDKLTKLVSPTKQMVTIKDIITETIDTKTFVLEGTKDTTLAPFKAGQYINVYVKLKNNETSRAYTISSSPSLVKKNIYNITVKKQGVVSSALFNDYDIGDTLEVSSPKGSFYYNSIRDESSVIAIAGGSGITPFMAMAEAINEGIEDFNLTIIYSVKNRNSIIFKERLEKLAKNKKIKVVITLTEEESDNYHYGRITKDLIEPYIDEFNTILMCGPQGLYKTMNDILSEFNIPRNQVHYESFRIEYKPEVTNTYNIKVIMNSRTINIDADSNETILVALEKAGIKAPNLCRVGSCGFCRSILIDGKIKMIGASLKKSEAKYNYIHPCVAYPESDLVIKLNM